MAICLARGEVRRRRLAGQQDFALISGDVDTGLFLNLFIFRQGAIDAQFRGTVIDPGSHRTRVRCGFGADCCRSDYRGGNAALQQ